VLLLSDLEFSAKETANVVIRVSGISGIASAPSSTSTSTAWDHDHDDGVSKFERTVPRLGTTSSGTLSKALAFERDLPPSTEGSLLVGVLSKQLAFERDLTPPSDGASLLF